MSRVAFAGRNFAVIKEICFAIGEAHEHESPAADISGGGLDDRQRKSYGHGGVYGVAAAFQNFDPCL